MLEMSRIWIQIIGNHIEEIQHPLNRAGIYTEDLLQAGNPLGFVSLTNNKSQTEPVFPEDIWNIDNNVTQLTLKKNLDAYLSHSRERFCANIIKPRNGKAVRYNNSSSYVIVCNTSLVYPLWLYKGNYYSDTSPRNSLRNYLKNNGAVNVISVSDFSGLKKYFDRYIDILLQEYGKEHILLIKAAPSIWYMADDGTFQQFDDNLLKLREFVIEADEYFVKKTGCVVLNTFEDYIPAGAKGTFPCAIYPQFALDALSGEIIRTIYRIERKHHANCQNDGGKPVSQLTGLPVNCVERFSEPLNNRIFPVQSMLPAEDEARFLKYLVQKNGHDPYLTDNDFQYIREYTKTGKLNIDGIVGIFMLYGKNHNHSSFREIAYNILHNLNCTAIVQSLQRFENNKVFLKNYPFFRGDLPREGEQCAFIKLNDHCLMAVLPDCDVPFRLVRFNSGYDLINVERVIEDGYCCTIEEAVSLCRSIKFYVQKAKHGAGNYPVTLKYESENSFIQSLYVLDYKYLLQNEPFLIGMEPGEAKGYCARTNLAFLFHEKTRIVAIRQGLADQITQYILSKCIQQEGMDIYYDDLRARSIHADHMGYELDKVIKEKIDEKCFSHILSGELVKSFDNHEKDLPDVLFEAGVFQLLAVACEKYAYVGYKKCSRVFYEIKLDHEYENLKYFVHGFEPYLTYYYCVIRPELLLLHYPLCLNQLFQFPEFEDETNSQLQQEMSRSTAVGVHIRRGDYTEWGETNQSYYKEAICKITSIPEYSEANIYVFSDDIPWCRANAEALGLLQAGKEKLTYVSHNKGDNNYRDMQLLALCRVIIGQQGGFARMAYTLSEKSEMFITPDKALCERFRKIGRGNKYDIKLITVNDNIIQDNDNASVKNIKAEIKKSKNNKGLKTVNVKDYKKMKRELRNIKRGWSFRLGRIITYLPRKIREHMKGK